MRTVLVVDDKEMMRDSVGATLQRAGFSIATADGAQAALDQIAQRRPDCVVTDMKMPGMTGCELLEKIRQIDDDLPVVMMTAFGTIETAVKAMKLGAFDYLTKPFEGDELIISVKRAIEHARVLRENALLRATGDHVRTSGLSGALQGVDRLIGKSTAMQKLREQIAAIAKSQGTVLVHGESGVGKEVVARALHEVGARGAGPFLAVNCAALSESLLESELFGHERGAFTGADKLRKGRFELADNGTLLLDEVSEVSPQLQAKLLRVLQERAFERVGSSITIGVDVRVVATTNRDLPAEISKGSFRQDLYFRLNVLPIHVPPLRERKGDVSELASHFVGQVAAREGRQAPAFEEAALAALEAYHWPGNVRELQNICERAVVLTAATGAERIDANLVTPWLIGGVPPSTPVTTAGVQIEPKPLRAEIMGDRGLVDATLEEIERETIVRTLHRFGGHRQKTAAALGIGVRTLGLKLKKWKQERLVAETL